MCRNIKTLHNYSPPVSDDEIHAAALQYVRKVSGMRKPSQANQVVFDQAVSEILAITERLIRDQLHTQAAPKNREAETQKARDRRQKQDAKLRLRIREEVVSGGT